MPFKYIDAVKIPAYDIVEARVRASGEISIVETGYDFDEHIFRFRLEGSNGRLSEFDLSQSQLNDLRDNPHGPSSRYTFELMSALNSKVLEAIESGGLISYGDEVLKYLLLKFIVNEYKNGRTVHKYNAVGRGMRGEFEQWLRTDLNPNEKDSLIWAWGELIRLRLIAPTGNDLVAPDEWVKATERGLSAVEGKSFTEYAEIEVLIGKGEVYTGLRQVQLVFQQAKRHVIIIDPWVDETMLDFIAALDPVISVQLATQNTSKGFGAAYAKLAQQRGNIEARSGNAFHDRFVILDGAVCYHFGSSLNHLGKKATIVSKKSYEILNRTLDEFRKHWPTAQPL